MPWISSAFGNSVSTVGPHQRLENHVAIVYRAHFQQLIALQVQAVVWVSR